MPTEDQSISTFLVIHSFRLSRLSLPFLNHHNYKLATLVYFWILLKHAKTKVFVWHFTNYPSFSNTFLVYLIHMTILWSEHSLVTTIGHESFSGWLVYISGPASWFHTWPEMGYLIITLHHRTLKNSVKDQLWKFLKLVLSWEISVSIQEIQIYITLNQNFLVLSQSLFPLVTK